MQFAAMPLLLALAFSVGGCAVQPWQQVKLTQSGYNGESQDFSVAPTSQMRIGNYEAPTPTTISGARTITTPELRDMMLKSDPPVLVDVVEGNVTASLPGAVWLPADGLSNSFALQGLTEHLAKLTNNNKEKPVVFFCLSQICWLSHNATVRAVGLGYVNVFWYRGGRDAWRAAGLAMEPVKATPF